MTTPIVDIENVVRLVLKRLSECDSRTAEDQCTCTEADTSTIDRLVTLETVASWNHNEKLIEIPAGRLVTPAARDEIKRRGIEIVRSREKHVEDSKQPEIRLGGWSTLDKTEALTGRLRREGYSVVAESIVADLGQFVAGLPQVTQVRRQLSVLLTEKPAAACCQLNRYQHIRAAIAFDWRSSCAAAEELRPNVAVFEAKHHSPAFIVNVIREWLPADSRG